MTARPKPPRLTTGPLILPVVVVVGDAPEVTEATASVRIERVEPGDRAPAHAFAVVVFDLRTVEVAELVAMRAQQLIAFAPLLLLSDDDVPDSVFALLRADDALVVDDRVMLTLPRRIAVLRDLAATRLESESQRRKLADTERFDRSILDGVEVGIVTTSEDGIITFANRAAVDLLDVKSLAGVDVVEALALPSHPEDLLDDDGRRRLAHTLVTGAGVELDLDLSFTRGGHDPGDLEGFFFIFRDVHEEKLREDERRRFERLAAMGTMVAGFAHEVRNPVAAMRSLVEELGEMLADHEITPHVRLILQMIERVERLVRTSLQFGRPAAPRRALQQPAAIVASALAELRPRLRALGDALRVEIDGGLPDVNVDGRQIAQALVILIQNALDATGASSRVVVRVQRARAVDGRKSEPPLSQASSGVVRFDVIDDGPGIPPLIFGRIFDPFFTTKAQGTGLGLSIAQQIIAENGARLDVLSPASGGAIFSIVASLE